MSAGNEIERTVKSGRMWAARFFFFFTASGACNLKMSSERLVTAADVTGRLRRAFDFPQADSYTLNEH